jgi:hypothetical protein
MAAPVAGQMDSEGTFKAAFFASTNAASGVHRGYQNLSGGGGLLGGQVYTWDCEIKAVGGYTVAQIGAHTGVAENPCYVSLVGSGSILSAGAGNSVLVTAKANGYYRIQVTRRVDTTNPGGFLTAQTTDVSLNTAPAMPVGEGFNLSFPAVYAGGPISGPIVETAATAVYLPRLTHSTLGVPLGTLIEGQATNLAKRTSDIGAAEWLTLSASKIGAGDPLPFGGTKYIVNLGATGGAFTGASGLYQSAAVFAASTAYTLTVYASAVSGTVTARIGFFDGVTDDGSADIVIGATPKRLEYTRTTAGGAGAGNFSIRNKLAGGAQGDLVIWAWDLVASPVATSHIPNPGTGTMVRAGDGNWDLTGADFTAIWGSGSERTIVVEWWDTGADSYRDIFVVRKPGGAADYADSIALIKYPGPNFYLVSYIGTTGTSSPILLGGNFGTLAAPVRNRVAYSVSASGVITVSLNGAAPFASSPGAAPAGVTDARIAGASLGWGPYQDILSSIRIVPTALTGSALQALSAL